MRVSNREEILVPVRHVSLLQPSLRFSDSHGIPDSQFRFTPYLADFRRCYAYSSVTDVVV